MDQVVDSYYKKEQRLLSIFKLFSGLSIFIAFIGLSAWAVYSTSQRTKEIGIRKVLGSSVGNIVSLLTGEFLKYVTIALLLAIPIGYFLSSQWLEEFAYGIGISPWIFIVTGLATWIIAFLTVSYQSILAAVKNPVTSLRYE